MSHDAAFVDTELIEDLVDNRSPFRNTASRFGMRCLGLPKPPPAKFPVSKPLRERSDRFTGRWR